MATNSDDQRKLKPKPAEESQQKASHRPHGVHKRLITSLLWFSPILTIFWYLLALNFWLLLITSVLNFLLWHNTSMVESTSNDIPV